MATHLGQSNRLQVCMTLGLGAYMHFHSSTCRTSPCMDSSTHTKLRLWIPPPQDTEHAVQGLCSQLKSKHATPRYLFALSLFLSTLQWWLLRVQLPDTRCGSAEGVGHLRSQDFHLNCHPQATATRGNSSVPEVTVNWESYSCLAPFQRAILRIKLIKVQSVKTSVQCLWTVNTSG